MGKYRPTCRRSRTHHTITCRCCGTKARVPLRRRFVCDNCFKSGGDLRLPVYDRRFDQKLTAWLMRQGIPLNRDGVWYGEEVATS